MRHQNFLPNEKGDLHPKCPQANNQAEGTHNTLNKKALRTPTAVQTSTDLLPLVIVGKSTQL